MNFTSEFFDQTTAILQRTVASMRPELMAEYGKAKYSFKDDKSVVTSLDGQLEILIRDALMHMDLSIGFEGEEHGTQGSRETYWLIDPIDGTEKFIRGLPSTMNMVTLIEGGVAQYCFIYKFITEELFEARLGMGATRNGQKISVSDRNVDRAWVELSMKELGSLTTLDVYSKLTQTVHEVVRMRDYVQVATGNLDGYIAFNAVGGPWDYAPRALLIQEAGGRVVNIGSQTYDFKIPSFIATNPVIFDQIWELTLPLIN